MEVDDDVTLNQLDDGDDDVMLVVIREGEAEAVRNPDDDEVAEAAQIQEVLFFCLQPPPEEEEEEEGEVVQLQTPPDTCMSMPIEPIDPEGKQQSVEERGECSRSVVHHDMFNCPICMEAVRMEDGFRINPCDHVFCVGCMIHYITVKAEESAVSIPCPAPGCETAAAIDPTTCEQFLSKDVFNRWCLTLCEMSLGLKKFYCPFKDCSAPLIDDDLNEVGDDEETTNSECPHCNRMFCARCKVPWHADMSCEEYEALGEDEKGREDLLLRNLANCKRWQRCPQCRMYVEKIDGCMFMKCRCAYCFCYACASPMSTETHYCAKCQR